MYLGQGISCNVGVFRYNPGNYSPDNPRPPGACCDIPDNPTGRNCDWTSEFDCLQMGGTWLGEYTTCRICGDKDLDTEIGKCCVPEPLAPGGYGCIDNVTEAECRSYGGNWSFGTVGSWAWLSVADFIGPYSRCVMAMWVSAISSLELTSPTSSVKDRPV